MTAHEFCTYFDVGYLPRALVLHESLVATGVDFRLTALCLDEESRDAVEALDDATFRAIGLSELEAHDPELLGVKPTRSKYEYYFTLGPSFMHLLLTRDSMQHLTYLDADMRFYADPSPLFAQSEGAAVVIVGHRFPERLRHLEATGKFNVAWVGFENDGDGLQCLEWWRERCIEWCFDHVDGDRYADQKYLDQFPTEFARVHVLQHPGADVAPWNLLDPPLAWDGERFVVAGEPLIFFHFQGFRTLWPSLIDPNLREFGHQSTPATRRLFRRYHSALHSSAHAHPVGSPRRDVKTQSRSIRVLVSRGAAVLRRQLILHRP